MKKSDLEKFRKKLEDMKAEINNDVEKTLNDMTSQGGPVPDPNDRASLESERTFELRIRGREQKLLEKINEALERIDEGTYGICEECGEEIRIKRLEARPVASYCIDCKTEMEQKEKAQGR